MKGLFILIHDGLALVVVLMAFILTIHIERIEQEKNLLNIIYYNALV